MKPSSKEKLRILLVEDSAADAMLIQRGFRKAGIACSIDWIEDGEKAIAFLEKRDGYQQAVRPDLIILDLNLPRLDGREVLHKIKNDSAFRRIPIVVMSTSDSERDISISYDLHANCYIVKPFDVNDFLQIASSIEQFWLRTVRLSQY